MSVKGLDEDMLILHRLIMSLKGEGIEIYHPLMMIGEVMVSLIRILGFLILIHCPSGVRVLTATIQIYPQELEIGFVRILRVGI